MAVPPHIRMTASGVFLGTTEEWSFGLSLATTNVLEGNEGYPGFEPNNTVWDDTTQDVGEFIQTAGYITNRVQLRTVKFAFIGSSGKYVREPQVRELQAVGAGSSTFIYPTQIALAATLVTDTPLNKIRGRFYIPGVTAGLDGTARIADSSATDIRNSVQTLLNNINNQPGFDVTGMRVVVASTKGTNEPVTAVRVGRVLDTIRARRNRLVEAYSDDAAVS